MYIIFTKSIWPVLTSKLIYVAYAYLTECNFPWNLLSLGTCFYTLHTRSNLIGKNIPDNYVFGVT